ncbi:11593_t:CDS:2, partial [Funneliformis mosseae]
VSAKIPPLETKVKVGLRKRQDTTFKFIPKVIVFTSMNEGVPGIKEFYSGDRDVLEKSIPGLTLLKYEDIYELKEINTEIARAKITSGKSKWDDLVKSPSWITWSVIMSIIYVIIIIVSMFLLVNNFKQFGFIVRNIKIYCYPGITFVCILGIIKLTIDPIHEAAIDLFTCALISHSKDLILFIIFTILEIQWKKAASIICQTHQHYSKHASNLIIKLSFTLEYVSIGLVGIEFILFGSYIFTALRKKVQRQRLRYKRKVTAIKVLIMNISFAFAIVFFVVTDALQFLIPTVVNLWLHLVLGNLGTAIACIIIILVLQDEIIGKNLQLANNTNRNFNNFNDNYNRDNRSSHSYSSSSSSMNRSSIEVTSTVTQDMISINRLSLDAQPVSTLSSPRPSISSPRLSISSPRPSLSSTRPPRNLTTI